MDGYKTIKKCRVCQSENLTKVLEIPPQYIATTFVKDNSQHTMSKIKIPLTLLLCEECGLVQLLETVRKELLYQNYFYRTAINDTMKRDLNDVVKLSHAIRTANHRLEEISLSNPVISKIKAKIDLIEPPNETRTEDPIRN